MPCYRIQLVTRAGNYTCPYTATASDLFKALVRLRRQLEPDGLTVAVQGSRRDTYPSAGRMPGFGQQGAGSVRGPVRTDGVRVRSGLFLLAPATRRLAAGARFGKTVPQTPPARSIG